MLLLYTAIPVYLITQRSERSTARLCFRRDPSQCCGKQVWYDYDFLYRSMTARRGISGQLVKECVTAFKHINHKAYGRLETRDGLVNAPRHRLLDVLLIEERQVVVNERVCVCCERM